MKADRFSGFTHLQHRGCQQLWDKETHLCWPDLFRSFLVCPAAPTAQPAHPATADHTDSKQNHFYGSLKYRKASFLVFHYYIEIIAYMTQWLEEHQQHKQILSIACYLPLLSCICVWASPVLVAVCSPGSEGPSPQWTWLSFGSVPECWARSAERQPHLGTAGTSPTVLTDGYPTLLTVWPRKESDSELKVTEHNF